MKSRLKNLILATTVSLMGCGESSIVKPVEETPTQIEIPSQGTEQTLEVITWNLQNFPKDENTIPYLAQIISSLEIDLYALQEISSQFSTLLDSLPGYGGFKSNSASYNIDLAYIFNPENISITNSYEIYPNNWYAFPRPPLVVEISYKGVPITIINNHLKCCDGEENESRRSEASRLLEDYIEENLQDRKIIVLGDWNDEIDFFQNFRANADEYQFTDAAISLNPSDWSYPNYPSHIDHILITNELFENAANPNSSTNTLKIEDYLENGWTEYNSTISDHRPVMLKLDLK